MSGLRTISAVFTAAAGLNAKQAAPLHFFATPVLKMNSPAFGNEDWQFFHHELSLSDCANHVHTRGGVPFLRHFLTGMAAPALRVGVASKNAPIDFRKLAIMQPRFTSAINVVAVIEHETCPV